MKVTLNQMNEAIKGGLNIIVIINGEYYDFVPDTKKDDQSKKKSKKKDR